jgi:hypothetical protein
MRLWKTREVSLSHLLSESFLTWVKDEPLPNEEGPISVTIPHVTLQLRGPVPCKWFLQADVAFALISILVNRLSIWPPNLPPVQEDSVVPGDGTVNPMDTIVTPQVDPMQVPPIPVISPRSKPRRLRGPSKNYMNRHLRGVNWPTLRETDHAPPASFGGARSTLKSLIDPDMGAFQRVTSSSKTHIKRRTKFMEIKFTDGNERKHQYNDVVNQAPTSMVEPDPEENAEMEIGDSEAETLVGNVVRLEDLIIDDAMGDVRVWM